MNGLERDTIGGFNSMIEQQKKTEGEALISTVLFDNVSEVLHDRVDVKDIRPMTDRDYTVRGCTALLDAIGGAIHHIGNIHKYARPEDVPEHTMFVITTDGMENASRRYDSEKVKQMIERQKAKRFLSQRSNRSGSSVCSSKEAMSASCLAETGGTGRRPLQRQQGSTEWLRARSFCAEAP